MTNHANTCILKCFAAVDTGFVVGLSVFAGATGGGACSEVRICVVVRRALYSWNAILAVHFVKSVGAKKRVFDAS